MNRYVRLADSLRTLDVSGNISIGNEGALQLLLACVGRELGPGDGTQTSINLRACGIESPLSNQFIQVVQQLHGMEGGERGGAKSCATFKVDLLGNLIDIGDMTLLSTS